ncbi:hypothetical protein [Humibacter soli]
MGTVFVEWHFFSVVDADDPTPNYAAVEPDGANWFLGSRERELRVFTGIALGELEIPVIVLDGPPIDDVVGEWDETGEATLNVPSGRLRVNGPADLGDTYEIRPGWVRIRIHRTRDDAIWDLVVDHPDGERYAIEAWPTDVPPEVRDSDRVPVKRGVFASSGGSRGADDLNSPEALARRDNLLRHSRPGSTLT